MPEETAVADATVLIFLGTLDRLDWLRDAVGHALIPPQVYEEVVERGKAMGAPDAVLVDAAVDDGWIEVLETTPRSAIQRHDLGAGETAVLSLALDQELDTVLVDEESVREVARLHGLKPRGTLWVLFGALRTGELDFDGFLDELERLLEAGFYLDEAVYLDAIRRARRIAGNRDSD